MPTTPTTTRTPAPAGETPTVPDVALAQPTAIVTDLGGETTVAQEAAAVTATKGTFTVAPGRTVDGKQPGETVELDDTDAKRMTDLGFVLGPDGVVVVNTDGPRVVQGAEIVER